MVRQRPLLGAGHIERNRWDNKRCFKTPDSCPVSGKNEHFRKKERLVAHVPRHPFETRGASG